MDELCERIEAAKSAAMAIRFADDSVRDAVCEIAECLAALADEVRKTRAAAKSACLAHGMVPDL